MICRNYNKPFTFFIDAETGYRVNQTRLPMYFCCFSVFGPQCGAKRRPRRMLFSAFLLLRHTRRDWKRTKQGFGKGDFWSGFPIRLGILSRLLIAMRLPIPLRSRQNSLLPSGHQIFGRNPACVQDIMAITDRQNKVCTICSLRISIIIAASLPSDVSRPPDAKHYSTAIQHAAGILLVGLISFSYLDQPPAWLAGTSAASAYLALPDPA